MTTSIHNSKKSKTTLLPAAAPVPISSALASSTLILVHTSAPITNRQDENFRSFVRNYAEFTGRKRHVVHVFENDKKAKKGLGYGRDRGSVVVGLKTPIAGRFALDDEDRVRERYVHKRERTTTQSDKLGLDDEEMDDRRKRQRFDDAVHNDGEDVEVVNSPGKDIFDLLVDDCDDYYKNCIYAYYVSSVSSYACVHSTCKLGKPAGCRVSCIY